VAQLAKSKHSGLLDGRTLLIESKKTRDDFLIVKIASAPSAAPTICIGHGGI
jgi:hypothetical protein